MNALTNTPVTGALDRLHRDAAASDLGLMEAMDESGQTAVVMKAAKAKGAVTTVDVFAGSPKDLPAIAKVLPYTDYFMPSIEEAKDMLSACADRLGLAPCR